MAAPLTLLPGGRRESTRLTPTAPARVSAPVRLTDLAPEQALRRLQLQVGSRLDGLLQGDHLTTGIGPGSEAGESALYQPGDDVRRMDWALTARTGEPHVRRTIADRELETTVLVDLSPSMDMGTADCEKRDLAVAAVAAVGHLVNRAGNRFGVVTLSPGGPVRVPAASGRRGYVRALRTVLDQPRGATDGPATPSLAEGLTSLERVPARRGLLVVVGDFLDTDPASDAPPPWFAPLRRLAQRHRVLAVEIVDPRELELPDVGYLRLVDPETGRQRDVRTGDKGLRARYAEAASQQRQAVQVGLRRAGAEHLRLRTDDDWVRVLARHVLTSAARRGPGRS